MTEKSEREKIREKKLRELQEQATADTAESSTKSSGQPQSSASQEEKIEQLVREATTAEARKRLNTVEMSKPDLAQEVKQQIATAQQAGRISEEIGEEKMKQVLNGIHEKTSTDFNIRR